MLLLIYLNMTFLSLCKKTSHFYSQLLLKGFIFILNLVALFAGKNQQSFHFFFIYSEKSSEEN